MTISILGAGSWATAIAHVLSTKHDVLLYARNMDDVESINQNHVNRKYLSEFKLAENIRATNNLECIFANKYIVNAIPTQSSRSVLEKIKQYVSEDHIFINLSKGLELKTHFRLSEIFYDILGNDITYAVLSGPTHAEEVILEMPTAIVCACEDEKVAKEIQEIFNTDFFRVYSSTDVIGVELGGAIKNTLALGIGIVSGLGYGDNTKAAIMTRGIHEMSRFTESFGAHQQTINGLAGIGDLIVTATSMHSRNNRAGILLGNGLSIEEVTNEINMVVEGIPTTRAIYELAREKNIELPITREIYEILYENKSADESIIELMGRNLKSEFI